MYSQSKSCVRLNNRLTDLFGNYVGVKQGDNLNPYLFFFGNYVGVKQGDNLKTNLFQIFINDLPDYLMNTTDPIFINKRSVHCLLYADDVILLSSTS